MYKGSTYISFKAISVNLAGVLPYDVRSFQKTYIGFLLKELVANFFSYRPNVKYLWELILSNTIYVQSTNFPTFVLYLSHHF